MSIHDKARALSCSSGISLTAAYAELSRRSAAARRARRSMGTMTASDADRVSAAHVESPRRQWLPYSDN